jgi:hypothetical protein
MDKGLLQTVGQDCSLVGEYRHYKGGRYRLLGICTHADTDEEFVLYSNIEQSRELPPGHLFIRAKEVFFSTVQMPDGSSVPRFQKL